MSIITRTKITVAAGFLGLAGLIGGTAAVAAASPSVMHEGPQASMVGAAQPGSMVGDGVLAAAPAVMHESAPAVMHE